MARTRRLIGVFDFETDPFQFGRVPEVFAVGYLDHNEYRRFWGVNCLDEFAEYLRQIGPRYLFAHNGGHYDFYFLLRHLANPFKIINGRIVSAHLGKHIVRDSYAILPIPLREFEKDTIDYTKMERENREANKREILRYLRKDCESLYKLVSAFIERFGMRLTIAGTAIKELQKHHPVIRTNARHDEQFRPFYFGGRVQCFETGILQPTKGQTWKIYDVNSMYPNVMASCLHPMGHEYIFTMDLPSAIASRLPFFIEFDGFSDGAFPQRETDGLSFPATHGTFKTTSHELLAALELGRCSVKTIHSIFLPKTATTFSSFVREWSAQKEQAKKEGNRANEIFAKLILNSAYGKFGSNPAHYHDWYFYHDGEYWPGACWEPYLDFGWLQILRQPARLAQMPYYDVATAASVTGAARACLLRALHTARRPAYCDTDSIICEALGPEIRQDSAALGAWKLEAQGDILAIAGKKLYALRHNNADVKVASKGISADGKIVLDIAQGIPYISNRAAPTFRKDGTAQFITRNIQMKGIE